MTPKIPLLGKVVIYYPTDGKGIPYQTEPLAPGAVMRTVWTIFHVIPDALPPAGRGDGRPGRLRVLEIIPIGEA